MLHAGAAFAFVWRILQWPIALAFVLIAFVMIYRFVPNVGAKREGRGLRRSDYRRRWLSPGVGIAIALWLLVSLGFRLYLHFFNSYSATYGSLGCADHPDAVVLSHRRSDPARQPFRALRDRGQRVAADQHGPGKIIGGGFEIAAVELVLVGEGNRVHYEVDLAPFLLQHVKNGWVDGLRDR